VKEADAHVDYESHQLLLYVERPDGTYGGLQTGAYAAKNYLDIFLENRANIIASGIEKLKKGEMSAIAFYMELNRMTVADLAARTGFSRAKVRKQLGPAGFATMTINDLRRYAEVFDITIADFFQVTIPRKNGVSVRRQKTANPLFTVIEII
jgi:hypothetical protein